MQKLWSPTYNPSKPRKFWNLWSQNTQNTNPDLAGSVLLFWAELYDWCWFRKKKKKKNKERRNETPKIPCQSDAKIKIIMCVCPRFRLATCSCLEFWLVYFDCYGFIFYTQLKMLRICYLDENCFFRNIVDLDLILTSWRLFLLNCSVKAFIYWQTVTI